MGGRLVSPDNKIAPVERRKTLSPMLGSMGSYSSRESGDINRGGEPLLQRSDMAGGLGGHSGRDVAGE